MIYDISKTRLFIKPGFTDMRKAINGLSIIAQEEMKLDPFSGSLFLFCGKSKRLLKILYWDKNGFCLWQKRLEKHRFPWPQRLEDCLEIDYDKIVMLLNGIDFWNAHEKLEYRSVV
jgi:transposase